MKPIPSYTYTCALPLNVRFHIDNGMITQVELAAHSENELRWQIVSKQPDGQLEALICSWMENYAAGKEPKIILPTSLNHLTPYTIKVLLAVEQIPFGSTAAYKDIAQRTGSPRASRAVGSACGRNPVPLIIPCHRVVACGSKIGGFGCGLEIKKHLLDFEKAIIN
jgi:methylated-DNA-[protein]-cysteine S-methyltransferase